MTPREARSTAAVGALPRDHIDVGGFWLLVDEATVTVAQQAEGEPARAVVTMPRALFERLVDWYTSDAGDA